MRGERIRKVWDHFTSALAAALLAVMLLVLVLTGQGWQHPLQSLRSRGECSPILEGAYAGRELRAGFPVYNMLGNEFLAFVKDPAGQVLFGLSYAARGGAAGYQAFQGRDGRYYLTAKE